MQTLKDLIDQNDRQCEVADRFCEAAHALARVANGTGGRVIPGPTAYDLLGNLKLALACLAEVVDFLPRGVRHSLTDERIRVYDEDFLTGEQRDPAAQASIAATHLADLLNHLTAANRAAEAAQAALNSQGYRTPAEESVR